MTALYPQETTILYKYLDLKGGKLMLENSNIQFSKVTQLNDPFDCHPGLMDFSRSCEGFYLEDPEDEEYIIEAFTNMFHEYRKKSYLCCLSEKKDSLLMWSYYNCHKGICIGLDDYCVYNYIEKQIPDGYSLSPPIKVDYKKVIDNKYIYSDPREKKKFISALYYIFSTKAIDWQHEEEVRMILNKDFDLNSDPQLYHYLSIPKEAFKEIYLGVNMELNDRKEIIDIAKRRNENISIYQMKIDHDSFKLRYDTLY